MPALRPFLQRARGGSVVEDPLRRSAGTWASACRGASAPRRFPPSWKRESGARNAWEFGYSSPPMLGLPKRWCARQSLWPTLPTKPLSPQLIPTFSWVLSLERLITTSDSHPAVDHVAMSAALVKHLDAMGVIVGDAKDGIIRRRPRRGQALASRVELDVVSSS